MKNIMAHLKWIVVIFVLLTQVVFAQIPKPISTENEINYCTDKESWDEWEDLVVKYPGDEDIIILHALRLGLCAKVNRNDITVKQATDIFEKVRTVIIERKEVTTKKDKGI